MIKQTESQSLGRSGERWFQGLLPREWLFQKPEDDIGLDGKVTIGTETTTGGLEFGVQVKAKRSWEIIDGVISVPSIKTDTLLFWGSRLYPTLLVLYDASQDNGYFGWVSDIITPALESHVEQHPKDRPQTVTLKVVAASVLTRDTFPKLRSDVETYYTKLVNSLRAARKSVNILPLINKLAEAVRGLHFSLFQHARSKEQRMLIDLMMVSSHRQVVESLRALQGKYHIDIGSQHFMDYFVSNYINEVNSIIRDFSSVFIQKEPVAVWVNPDAHRRHTPRIIDMILDLVLLLTDETPRERGRVFTFDRSS